MSFRHSGQIVKIGFPDDAVYYPNESHLSEYIESDVGFVYKGTYKEYHERRWLFGQFEAIVLPACCLILDRSRLKPAERGNPIKVKIRPTSVSSQE